jgi:hypothetical protein
VFNVSLISILLFLHLWILQHFEGFVRLWFRSCIVVTRHCSLWFYIRDLYQGFVFCVLLRKPEIQLNVRTVRQWMALYLCGTNTCIVESPNRIPFKSVDTEQICWDDSSSCLWSGSSVSKSSWRQWLTDGFRAFSCSLQTNTRAVP